MKELANLLATTPETVSRRLKTLKRDGYLLRNARTIRIVDPEAFQTYVWNLKNE